MRITYTTHSDSSRTSRGNSKPGFTLVELVVVITVISILATLATLSLVAYQRNGRDGIRSSSATVITEALEKYYFAHGEYPTCAQMTATPATITTDTFPGINVAVLKAPKADTGVTNSITCTASATQKDEFLYTPNVSTGGWTFSYINEVDGALKTTTSRQTVGS